MWLIAQVARTFGISPIQAREELDSDAEELLLKLLPFYSYAEAHAVYRRAKKEELDAWKGVRIMQTVTDIDFALVKRERDGR